MKKLTLELTDEQFEALCFILLDASETMRCRAETWETLAAEKNEDGTRKFPSAVKIVDLYTGKALRSAELYQMIKGY